jgi:hypothetical protein
MTDIQVGETRGSDAPIRRLIQTATLPEYLSSADRIAHIADDIHNLTAQMRATLTAKAHEFHVRGYTLDEDSWELASNRNVIVLTVTIRRPA